MNIDGIHPIGYRIRIIQNGTNVTTTFGGVRTVGTYKFHVYNPKGKLIESGWRGSMESAKAVAREMVFYDVGDAGRRLLKKYRWKWVKING